MLKYIRWSTFVLTKLRISKGNQQRDENVKINYDSCDVLKSEIKRNKNKQMKMETQIIILNFLDLKTVSAQ